MSSLLNALVPSSAFKAWVAGAAPKNWRPKDYVKYPSKFAMALLARIHDNHYHVNEPEYTFFLLSLALSLEAPFTDESRAVLMRFPQLVFDCMCLTKMEVSRFLDPKLMKALPLEFFAKIEQKNVIKKFKEKLDANTLFFALSLKGKEVFLELMFEEGSMQTIVSLWQESLKNAEGDFETPKLFAAYPAVFAEYYNNLFDQFLSQNFEIPPKQIGRCSEYVKLLNEEQKKVFFEKVSVESKLMETHPAEIESKFMAVLPLEFFTEIIQKPVIKKLKEKFDADTLFFYLSLKGKQAFLEMFFEEGSHQMLVSLWHDSLKYAEDDPEILKLFAGYPAVFVEYYNNLFSKFSSESFEIHPKQIDQCKQFVKLLNEEQRKAFFEKASLEFNAYYFLCFDEKHLDTLKDPIKILDCATAKVFQLKKENPDRTLENEGSLATAWASRYSAQIESSEPFISFFLQTDELEQEKFLGKLVENKTCEGFLRELLCFKKDKNIPPCVFTKHPLLLLRALGYDEKKPNDVEALYYQYDKLNKKEKEQFVRCLDKKSEIAYKGMLQEAIKQQGSLFNSALKENKQYDLSVDPFLFEWKGILEIAKEIPDHFFAYIFMSLHAFNPPPNSVSKLVMPDAKICEKIYKGFDLIKDLPSIKNKDLKLFLNALKERKILFIWD